MSVATSSSEAIKAKLARKPVKPMPVLFVSKEGMATFWFLVSAGALLWAAFSVYRIATSAGLRPQYIIMESPLVNRISNEMLPEREDEVHRLQTRLLVDSIFNKNPAGLDSEDRCKRLLSHSAWKWVSAELIEKQKDAFSQGRMHQKIELESLTLSKRPEGVMVATIKGSLYRAGVLDSKFFNEVWVVRGQFAWRRNPSLRECGRYPVICDSLNCKEIRVSSTLEPVPVTDENEDLITPQIATPGTSTN